MRLFFLYNFVFLFALGLPLPALAVTKFSVPFTTQAPFANWSEPWQNACEETTIVMVDHFYTTAPLTRIAAKNSILRTIKNKEALFGASFDETAEEMVKLINAFYPWEAEVINNPTLEQIKNEISAARPVILPLYGDRLGNPFFKGSVPYHTVVITGFDDDSQEFLAHEPGTRRGENFRYSYDVIMYAIGDYIPGMTPGAPKRAIFTRGNLVTSNLTDSDNDGLTKEEELRIGTSLTLSDTDGDGFSDGTEVKNGYNPLLPSKSLEDGMLVKAPNEATVFLIKNHQKLPISSAKVFFANGWSWDLVQIIDLKIIKNTLTGKMIRE